MKIKLSYVFNPFEKIAGLKALIFGLCFMGVTCFINTKTDYVSFTYFSTDMPIILERTASWHLFVRTLIPWLILSFSFYFLALIFSKSKVRFIDVLGTLAFCQIAVMGESLTHFSSAINELIRHEKTFDDILEMPTIFEYIFTNSFSLFCLIWFCVLNFNAVKISCNLKKARLWTIYIIVMILSCALSVLAQTALSNFITKAEGLDASNIPVNNENIEKLRGLWKGEITISETKKELVYMYFMPCENKGKLGFSEAVVYIPNRQYKIVYPEIEQGEIKSRVNISGGQNLSSISLYSVKEKSFQLRLWALDRFTTSSMEKFTKVEEHLALLAELESECKDGVIPPTKNIEYRKSTRKENPAGVLLENDFNGGLFKMPLWVDSLCADDGKIYRITHLHSFDYVTSKDSFVILESFDANLDSLGAGVFKFSKRSTDEKVVSCVSSFKVLEKNKLGFLIHEISIEDNEDGTSQKTNEKSAIVYFDAQTGEFSRQDFIKAEAKELVRDFITGASGETFIASYTFIDDEEERKTARGKVILRKYDNAKNKIAEFLLEGDAHAKLSYRAKKLMWLDNKNIAFLVSGTEEHEGGNTETEFTNVYILDSELKEQNSHKKIKGSFLDIIKTDSGKIALANSSELKREEEDDEDETIQEYSKIYMTFFDSEMNEITLQNDFEVSIDYHSLSYPKLLDLKNSLMLLLGEKYNYWIISNDGVLKKSFASPYLLAGNKKKNQEKILLNGAQMSGVMSGNNFYATSFKGEGIFGVQYLLKTEIPKE